MEKAVVFGPMIIFFVIFIILIIAFIGFIVKIISKSKNEDWYGEVIDKKVNEVEDFDTGSKSDHYFLVVKIEGSRNRHIGLSRDKWEAFSVGDKLHKPKGKLFPEKV